MENHTKFRLSQFVRIGVLFLLFPLFHLVRCDGLGAVCTKVNSCECEFTDGSGVISLKTIASTNGPRFPYTKSSTPTDHYFYAYNPCNSFSDTYCQDVAACQRSEDGKEFFDVGDQESATFDDLGTTLTYASGGETPRSTIVSLICEISATTPVLEVIGEESQGSGKYKFNLRSNCACKNGCLGGGISAGSVLCILFSVGVILYLVIGILFLKFVRGSEGKEVIPNFEFWKDFPLLVKDGVLFLASGCKSDSNNYEQI
ncbi:uncharacterized protein LOC117299851 [Asterias rubens]|uniref:uncharacterized protein LOC117299851 n=1 Tax=Asterias rubens TaxID=7604 RepID=UPI00145547E1|nr:uncharacterized protein LOC117299851 [Asterias rubens]